MKVSSLNPYINPVRYCVTLVRFGHYQIMQKIWKVKETLSYGYSSEIRQWELSNEYQHDKV